MRRSLSICCILTMLLSAGAGLYAQAPRPSNVGNEFFLSFPANWDYAVPEKYVRLYISCVTSAQVLVYGGETLIATRMTLPNDIITVDIPLIYAQPFTRNDVSPVPQDQVYPNKAIRVIADAPITVYGINRVTYTTDGILALPTTSLGREYVVASAPDISDHNAQKLPSQYVITAVHDNTVVTIVNSWDTYGHEGGETFTVAMQKGDVYSAMSKGQLSDLTGTLISASKPVAVLSGQNCTYLPSRQYAACDHIVEMLLPVESWGRVYHLVPFAQRQKGDFIRVFSGASNATVLVNGVQTAVLPEKGGVEGRGWFTMLEPQRRLMEFISDKPINVAQYNNSQQYDNVNTDPFLLVLTPMEQYQTAFTFSTPGTDYGQNFINLVLDSSDWTNIEIAPGGTENWRKLAVETGPTPQNFPTLINGVRYAGISFDIKPGVYRLRGTKPFAGYIYGWSSYDSYGYPLSLTVADLAGEPQPTFAPTDPNIPGLTLGPVAPTPSNGSTTLSYAVPKVSPVEITLVDATGRTVQTVLAKSIVAEGSHTVRFDVSSLPAGRYFCRMNVGERVLVQPLVIR